MDKVNLAKTGPANRIFVAGVVSYGEQCASKNKPGLYYKLKFI